MVKPQEGHRLVEAVIAGARLAARRQERMAQGSPGASPPAALHVEYNAGNIAHVMYVGNCDRCGSGIPDETVRDLERQLAVMPDPAAARISLLALLGVQSMHEIRLRELDRALVLLTHVARLQEVLGTRTA